MVNTLLYILGLMDLIHWTILASTVIRGIPQEFLHTGTTSAVAYPTCMVMGDYMSE